MLAHISTVIGFEGLVVAVHGFHHDAAQGAVFVAGQQGVPIAAPQEFDNVPAGAAEFAFEFLHDLAVTTHWTV